MSRRARSRRDKRAPIPDFDDPQPRMPGLFISGAINECNHPTAHHPARRRLPHAAAVAGHVLVGVVLHWAPSPVFAASAAAARSRLSSMSRICSSCSATAPYWARQVAIQRAVSRSLA